LLALDANRGGVHPAFHPVLGHCAVRRRAGHQHHDAGGLALAVGILVDDATVMIENINTHLEMAEKAGGEVDLRHAIIEASNQIVVPTPGERFGNLTRQPIPLSDARSPRRIRSDVANVA